MKFVPTYTPRPSALHSARAGVAASFCGALAFAGALDQHPLILAAALLGIGLAATGAGVGREVLGRRVDITLEATVAGALAGVRLVVIIVALWLLSVAVDPDALLRLFRRISYRSALTASLATRLVPVLARDASRMSEAARCRPQPAGRLAVARSALAGALDRSVDLAAALELRGYALGGRPERRRVPWSRHDIRLAAAAGAIVLLTVAGRIAGVADIETYPELQIEMGPAELALAAAIVALAAAPFAGRAARLGVARA